MRNIILFCIFFIFFGCVTHGKYNTKSKVEAPFTTNNIFPLLKVLREYELLDQDYYNYKRKKKSKNIDAKKRDINYIKSLTKRYDEWNSSWGNSINLNGKVMTVYEWKIINRSLNEVFGDVNNLKALNMLINNYISQIQIDSLIDDFNLEQNY